MKSAVCILRKADNASCLTNAKSVLQQEIIPIGKSAGVKRPLEGLTLLENPEETLKEPWTQEAPVMTEDMLMETEATISALGETTNADHRRSITCNIIYIRTQ